MGVVEGSRITGHGCAAHHSPSCASQVATPPWRMPSHVLQILDRLVKGIREAPSKAIVSELAARSGDSASAAFSARYVSKWRRVVHHDALCVWWAAAALARPHLQTDCNALSPLHLSSAPFRPSARWACCWGLEPPLPPSKPPGAATPPPLPFLWCLPWPGWRLWQRHLEGMPRRLPAHAGSKVSKWQRACGKDTDRAALQRACLQSNWLAGNVAR